MSIILKKRLINGIGINTGNNIINFLLKRNTFIPCKVKYSYSIKSLYKKIHNLEFYFGNNLTIENNILFYKIILPTNTNININCDIFSNIAIIFISSKIKVYDKIIIKLYNDYIKYIDINSEIIQKNKLYYELNECIESIIHKLQVMNLNSEIKKNITSKLQELYKNKKAYKNLQIMKKIQELKNKFLI